MNWTEKLLEDGISHCARWVFGEARQFGIQGEFAVEDIRKAAQFLTFGGTYQKLVDVHSTYSQGLLRGEVDPEKRVVRFFYPDHEKSWVNAAGVHDRWTQTGVIVPKIARKILRLNRRLLKDLVRESCSIVGTRIVLSDFRILATEEFGSAIEIGKEDTWLPMPPDSDLQGFSLRDLTRFWRALSLWSHAVLGRFTMEYYGTSNLPSSFPPQLVCRDTFLSMMQRHTELGSDAVRRILARLTFAGGATKSDLILTPLIEERGYITWSPNVVIHSQYLRNMLKLMARTPELKARADTLIGTSSDPLLNEMRNMLQRQGYQCSKLNVPIASDSDQSDVDLLCWAGRARDEVLLFEAKFVLPADDVNEVKDLTNKLISGQQQVRRILDILRELPVGRKKALFPFVPWDSIRRIYAIVLNNEGSPNERYDFGEIPTIDLVTIKNYLRQRDLRIPRNFLAAATDREWMNELREATPFWEPVQIGDVQYDIPMLGID